MEEVLGEDDYDEHARANVYVVSCVPKDVERTMRSLLTLFPLPPEVIETFLEAITLSHTIYPSVLRATM